MGSAGGASGVFGGGNIVAYHTTLSNGQSLFECTFDVTAPTAIALSGTVHSNYLFGPGPVASIVLQHAGGATLASVAATPQPGDVPLTYSATLDPGQYTLSASAVTNQPPATPQSSGSQTASFQFTLQEVPEPAAILAPCLAGIALARRRRPSA